MKIERPNLSEAYAQQEVERKAAGRYRLSEAADLIASHVHERVESLLPKLMAAAKSGDLPMYGPGERARHVYASREGVMAPVGQASRVRDFYEEAYWDDLNKWIEGNEGRLEFRFPSPTAAVRKQISRASDVAACQSWLTELMRGSPNGPSTKKVCLEKAKLKWPNLADRAFSVAWGNALSDSGAHAWGAAGRRPNRNRSTQ